MVRRVERQNGNQNHNWKGGTSKSTVRRKTREVLFRAGRDLNKCERCGFTRLQELPRHHKDRDRTNNNISNIEVLCQGCHNKEHMEERGRDLTTGRFTK